MTYKQFNSLDDMTTEMSRLEANRIYFKHLSPNDNSKNQIYLGPNLEALSILPIGEIEVSELRSKKPSASNKIFKASLNFYWASAEGYALKAPNAQVIYYPQYPEVRASGFLKGCPAAPQIMAQRLEGRVLFFAVTSDRKIIAHVVDRTSPIVKELAANPKRVHKLNEVISELVFGDFDNSSTHLLKKLRQISQKGWITARRLTTNGLQPCQGGNCGGLTLEAELEVTQNGRSEPDYNGWEIKQFNLAKFSSRANKVITVMTPEPTGGLYKEKGAEDFVIKYGYKDSDDPTRLNFSGIYKCNKVNPKSGLKMILEGFDTSKGRIAKAEGCIRLVDDKKSIIAASWDFAGLLTHWNKKHFSAAYIPSLKQLGNNGVEYRYGGEALLGFGTELNLFLSAFSAGTVYYDPGIHLDKAGTLDQKIKKRSQFRIKRHDVKSLYKNTENHTLSER